MTYYVITKDGEPTTHQTANALNAYVGAEFLKEIEPEHEWDVEEVNVEEEQDA